MTYFWRYDGPDGPRESPRAEDQRQAEAWLSENWPDLADDGVDEVTLLTGDETGDEVVYGPMGLDS